MKRFKSEPKIYFETEAGSTTQEHQNIATFTTTHRLDGTVDESITKTEARKQLTKVFSASVVDEWLATIKSPLWVSEVMGAIKLWVSLKKVKHVLRVQKSRKPVPKESTACVGSGRNRLRRKP